MTSDKYKMQRSILEFEYTMKMRQVAIYESISENNRRIEDLPDCSDNETECHILENEIDLLTQEYDRLAGYLRILNIE